VPQQPRIAIFGPHPLLTVSVEEHDDIHLHVGGQGVWVARMARELGGEPVLCGFAGGERGDVVRALVPEARLVPTLGETACWVVDRRGEDRQVIAAQLSPHPTRHEVDDLFSITVAAALDAAALVVCNPFPGDALPLELYENLVGDVRGAGVPVLVDLSSPRLDRALAGRPDLVKINDWELAEFVRDAVDPPERLWEAVERLRAAGAQDVVITRGAESAFAAVDGRRYEIVPPRFDRGARAGCGDTMVGALAAARAAGASWTSALVTGAAAGAANFLRHGLGTGHADVVRRLEASVELREL
jgi:1-phosphofructokinase